MASCSFPNSRNSCTKRKTSMRKRLCGSRRICVANTWTTARIHSGRSPCRISTVPAVPRIPTHTALPSLHLSNGEITSTKSTMTSWITPPSGKKCARSGSSARSRSRHRTALLFNKLVSFRSGRIRKKLYSEIAENNLKIVIHIEGSAGSEDLRLDGVFDRGFVVLQFTRRKFLCSTVAFSFSSRFDFAEGQKLRIGVTDWNLKAGADPDAVSLAAQFGFDGLQVSFGRKLVDDKMPGDNPEIVARYLRLSKQYKIPIDGMCVDRLHVNGLKSDGMAAKWVVDSIRLTKALNAKVLLLPFFGRWALQNKDEMDHVGDVLRELAQEAEKAGVILGLEDTISAEDNVRIMDRSRSASTRVYYDVGNSTKAGFDVVKEIRWLGKDRICQIHLKDNPHYMGEGTIPFPEVMKAIRDIGFTGYANLETDTLPGSTVEADMRRNLAFVRKLV